MPSPVLTTAALFTAIIINDAITKNSSSIINHAFLGLIAVLATSYLSMKGAETAAWGIITLPTFVIVVSFLLSFMNSPSTSHVESSSTITTRETPLGVAANTPGQLNVASGLNTPPQNSLSTRPTTIQNPIGKEIRLPYINPSNVTPNSASCNAAHV